MQTRPNPMRGALCLAGAGMIVKVIGACFKIPLGALLKPEGTAIFSVAYHLYAFLFSLATAGVPVAVSKLVAESGANGALDDTAETYRTARRLFGGVGLGLSLLLFFGAEWFSDVLGAPGAAAAIRAVSPSVFLVSVLSVERGYFQGFGNMAPTAVSEIIEAAGKLVLGLSLAWWLAKKGSDLGVQAAGAIAGVSLGCALSVLYFALIRRTVRVPIKTGRKPKPRTKQLLSQSVPITLSASVIGLVSLIDSAVIMKTLRSAGVSETRAMWMFGTYTYASNLFSLPNTLVTALAVSLIPAVAANLAQGETTNETVEPALRIGLLLSLTGAVGLAVLARPILSLLYGSGVEETALSLAGELLVILCFGIPPLALTTVTNAVHQASGRVKLPVVSMLFGAAVKLVSNCILLRHPDVSILGAAVSTVLCYAVTFCIGWFSLPDRPSLVRVSGKPILIAIFTGIAAKVSFLCGNHLVSEKLAAIFGVFIGGIAFFWISSAAKIPVISDRFVEKSEKFV